MKKIILGLMFAFVAGICFGQYTVAVIAVNGAEEVGSKLKPIVATETLTQLLETSAAQLGYTVIDRTAIDEASKYLGIESKSGYSSSQFQRIARELNADFLIIGLIYSSTFRLTITDMKNGKQESDRFRITKAEKSTQRKFENVMNSIIGKADMQQEYQQELAKRDEGALPEDAWRNKKVYLGFGGGVGFGMGLVQIGDEIQSGFGANITGSFRTDFGKSNPHVSNKGYAIDYAAFGTGLFVSGANGNVSFMIPLEGRFARRYNRTELGFGGGIGVGFGAGSFSLPVIFDGSIGWKAGPGIILFEGMVGYDLIAAAGKTMGFSGSVIMGYKFGVGK